MEVKKKKKRKIKEENMECFCVRNETWQGRPKVRGAQSIDTLAPVLNLTSCLQPMHKNEATQLEATA